MPRSVTLGRRGAVAHEHSWGTIQNGLIYCDAEGCDARRPITDDEAADFIWGTDEPSTAHEAVELAIAEITAELAAADTHAGVTDPAVLAEGLDRPSPAAEGLDRDSLIAALEALERSHKATSEGVVALVASAVQDRGATNSDQIALETLAVLRAMALRPEPAAPAITVNVPEQAVHVSAPVTVTLPEQPAPVVNVAAPAAAPVHVDVHVPEQPIPEAQPIHVDVHVPEPAAAAAPDVHVHMPAPAPSSRSVRVEFDQEGGKRYVVDETPVDALSATASHTPRPDEVALETLAALRAIAERPDPAITVNVPEPTIHVHVPEIAAAAPARSVRVEFDADGNKRYVVEQAEE